MMTALLCSIPIAAASTPRSALSRRRERADFMSIVGVRCARFPHRVGVPQAAFESAERAVYLSRTLRVLKAGRRWVDCPPEYGPDKTIYNLFNHWNGQRYLGGIFIEAGH
jgi:hypothetical protein